MDSLIPRFNLALSALLITILFSSLYAGNKVNGEENYFPLNTENVYQYFVKKSEESTGGVFRLLQTTSGSSVIVDGKEYYKLYFWPSSWLRYDLSEQKVYYREWDNVSGYSEENLVFDLSIESGEYTAPVMETTWSATYSVTTDSILYNDTFLKTKTFEFGSYHKVIFLENFGIYYEYSSYYDQGMDNYTRHQLISAKLFDTEGNVNYYDSGKFPEIDPDGTVAILENNILKFTSKINHSYSATIYSQISGMNHTSYIDSAIVTLRIPGSSPEGVSLKLEDDKYANFKKEIAITEVFPGWVPEQGLEYRIYARDKSFTPHKTYYPVNGWEDLNIETIDSTEANYFPINPENNIVFLERNYDPPAPNEFNYTNLNLGDIKYFNNEKYYEVDFWPDAYVRFDYYDKILYFHKLWTVSIFPQPSFDFKMENGEYQGYAIENGEPVTITVATDGILYNGEYHNIKIFKYKPDFNKFVEIAFLENVGIYYRNTNFAYQNDNTYYHHQLMSAEIHSFNNEIIEYNNAIVPTVDLEKTECYLINNTLGFTAEINHELNRIPQEEEGEYIYYNSFIDSATVIVATSDNLTTLTATIELEEIEENKFHASIFLPVHFPDYNINNGLKYKIFAKDKSPIPNTVTYPEEGWEPLSINDLNYDSTNYFPANPENNWMIMRRRGVLLSPGEHEFINVQAENPVFVNNKEYNKYGFWNWLWVRLDEEENTLYFIEDTLSAIAITEKKAFDFRIDSGTYNAFSPQSGTSMTFKVSTDTIMYNGARLKRKTFEYNPYTFQDLEVSFVENLGFFNEDVWASGNGGGGFRIDQLIHANVYNDNGGVFLYNNERAPEIDPGKIRCVLKNDSLHFSAKVYHTFSTYMYSANFDIRFSASYIDSVALLLKMNDEVVIKTATIPLADSSGYRFGMVFKLDDYFPGYDLANGLKYRIYAKDKDPLTPHIVYYPGSSWEDLEIENLVSVDDGQTPEVYETKLANYPNPFNSSTIIEYSLEEAGNISLELYNILGEKVRTIKSGYSNKGKFQYNLNMSGYSSGIYLYVLKTGKKHIVKKMCYLE